MSSAASVRVVAAVVRRYGRLLVCQRPAHKRHGGLWEFPGGKLEPGESVFDGARRELAEELRVTVRTVDEAPELSVADPGSEFVIEFHGAEIDGDPRCIEHTSLAWVTPEQLLTLPLAPSDREFALHLQRERGATTGRGASPP
jgi:mutator protein MutT